MENRYILSNDIDAKRALAPEESTGNQPLRTEEPGKRDAPFEFRHW